jgi:SAM-dependent methyltransferase
VTPISTEAAYDSYGEDYQRWMAPVVGPSAVRLLDRLDGRRDLVGPLQLLDVGVGTGTLVLAALERWHGARAIGVDPSRVMLRLAEGEARRRAEGIADRLRLMIGDATALPLQDASIDMVLSSFVIQLVSSRAAALREMLRVLRPGGTIALLTWQVDDEPFEPEEVVLDVFEDLEIEVPEGGGGGTRPYSSPDSAAAEFRRIGFRDVQAVRAWLEHAYTPESFVDVVEHWTDDDIVAGLTPDLRAELRSRLLDRLRRLDRGELLWRRPLVSVVARRP